MNILEIIKKRRSVRTFDSNDLREEDVKKLMDFAERVENPYALPITWKVLNAKENGLASPVIVGTDTFIAGKMSRVPHAEEAFGYAFEKIVLFLESIGVGTTWIAGTMNRVAFERAMEVSSGEIMPCVSPLGYPAQKMSLRESLMRKGIKADTRYDFNKLFFDGNFETPLMGEKANKLKTVLEGVRFAPSAVNKQPWRILFDGDRAYFYEKHSKGYISDGWDIQKIDMGIALCHFDLAAKECGIDLAFEISDPCLKIDEDMEYIATYIIK